MITTLLSCGLVICLFGGYIDSPNDTGSVTNVER